jgi:hypothetical protein
MNNEPVLYVNDEELAEGYYYIEGSHKQGSFYNTPLYRHPAKTLTDEEIAELKNARDYWCLQYKDIFSKLERISNERCGGKDEDSSRHRN